MHKSTKEILSRRAAPAGVNVEDKGGEEVVLWVGGDSRETHSVTVNEKHRTFAVGRVEIVAPGANGYRIRSWRESLYADAIHELLRGSGRYSPPSVCVVLGSVAARNEECLKAAIRMGLPRMTVVGDRQAELMERYEVFTAIEYLPSTAPRPEGINLIIFDANAPRD